MIPVGARRSHRRRLGPSHVREVPELLYAGRPPGREGDGPVRGREALLEGARRGPAREVPGAWPSALRERPRGCGCVRVVGRGGGRRTPPALGTGTRRLPPPEMPCSAVSRIIESQLAMAPGMSRHWRRPLALLPRRCRFNCPVAATLPQAHRDPGSPARVAAPLRHAPQRRDRLSHGPVHAHLRAPAHVRPPLHSFPRLPRDLADIWCARAVAGSSLGPSRNSCV